MPRKRSKNTASARKEELKPLDRSPGPTIAESVDSERGGPDRPESLDNIAESLARLEKRYGALLEKSLDTATRIESDWILARDRAENQGIELVELKHQLEESKKVETRLLARLDKSRQESSEERSTWLEESKQRLAQEKKIWLEESKKRLEEGTLRDREWQRQLQAREKSIADLERQLARDQEGHARAKEEIEAMKARFSWRITAPIRWIRNLL